MKLKVPKFKSEEEEANWWFDHREDHAKAMANALAKGEGTALADILNRRRKRLGITPTVSIRIDPIDIARARRIATKKGLPYQTLLKTVIREGLRREEKRLAS
jgi:ParB-like chromosome segregation protein Spo0J